MILGYLSSSTSGYLERTRKVSRIKSVESANVPDDLSGLRFLSVDKSSVSSDSRDCRSLLDCRNISWWNDVVGFSMGIFVWYGVGGGCKD